MLLQLVNFTLLVFLLGVFINSGLSLLLGILAALLIAVVNKYTIYRLTTRTTLST